MVLCLFAPWIVGVECSPNVTISVTVDEGRTADDILLPGEHVLNLSLSNRMNGPLAPGFLSISLSKLHKGEVWHASEPTPGIEANESSLLEIPVKVEEPGLYTMHLQLESDGLIKEVSSDLLISHTLDRWQEWRTRIEVRNKTHLLLAFYYPWYGNPRGPAGRWLHWTPWREYDSTHVPLIGFYDSLSDGVIRYHVRIAQSIGLDGFISSWWGPGNYIDDAFPKLLEISAGMGFNATIYLEMAKDRDDLRNQLLYVMREYGDHPAFLKWEGRPVIFIYGRVMGAFDLETFEAIFVDLAFQGFSAFYIADRLDARYLEVFDGLHTYNPLAEMDRYPRLSEDIRSQGKIFAATIAPGYDDTVIRDPGMVVDRANGTFYRDSWERIMLSKADWVLITSWNEWHEGSEIEPSLEFGDQYLNLTSYYYELFESDKLTPRWEARIQEIAGLFSVAARLVKEANEKGMDVRIMERDYSIAEGTWRNYDYDITKAYLLRITDREDEIKEMSFLPAVLSIFVLLRLSGNRRAR